MKIGIEISVDWFSLEIAPYVRSEWESGWYNSASVSFSFNSDMPSEWLWGPFGHKSATSRSVTRHGTLYLGPLQFAAELQTNKGKENYAAFDSAALSQCMMDEIKSTLSINGTPLDTGLSTSVKHPPSKGTVH